MPMEIIYSPSFKRAYKRLPENIKDIAEKKEEIFRKDPFDERLRTHALEGRLKGLYSFSIDRKNRIIFEFSDDRKIVIFHTVGSHDIYK